MFVKVGIASGDWMHPRKINSDTPKWGGSGWARMGQYVDLLPFEVVVGVLTWVGDHFFIVDLEGDLHDVEVIYMQRLMHEGLVKHIPQARAYGQKIINDIDDWYWGLSPANQAFFVNHPKHNPTENIDHYRSLIGKSDIVTVSTPYLADRIASFVKCPIILLPNYVDTNRFASNPGSSPPVSTVTVGWVGSTAHRSGDIETVAGWLRPMAERGEVLLYHGGNHISAPTFASKLSISEDLVRTKPATSAEDYPTLMDMDIGIVPLSKIPFNEAKSDIKGLEYSSAGIPFVAQDTGSYKALKKDYGLGYIASKPAEWIRHIKRLSDPTFRSESSAMHRELVKKRDIKYGAEQLGSIIKSL